MRIDTKIYIFFFGTGKPLYYVSFLPVIALLSAVCFEHFPQQFTTPFAAV